VYAFLTIAGIEPESGGPSRCVPSLANGLAHQGIDVRLLTLCSDLNALKDLTSQEYKLYGYEFANSLFGKLKAVERLRRDLSNQVHEYAGRSIIHDNGIWLLSNHAVVSVARKTRTPSVVSTHGMLSPWALNHKALKKKIAWQLYQKRDLSAVDLIHATSQQEAQIILESGLNKPVAVVPNGVDVPPWRERIVAGRDKRTILFLSRIYPVKGLLNLVNAWQQIKASDWKIVVAGPDEAGHQKEVMAAVHAAGLQDWFEFVGPVADNDKWDLFFSADLFVLPSFTENFGIVVAEALACGVPAITTIGTPWRELVTRNCGWWVEIGPEPLAEALRSAISLSDEERSEMGKRGRVLVETGYSWEKISEDMKTVYAWLIDKSPKPGCIMPA